MAAQGKTSRSKERVTVLLLLILSKAGMPASSCRLLPPCQLFRALGTPLTWKVNNYLDGITVTPAAGQHSYHSLLSPPLNDCIWHPTTNKSASVGPVRPRPTCQGARGTPLCWRKHTHQLRCGGQAQGNCHGPLPPPRGGAAWGCAGGRGPSCRAKEERRGGGDTPSFQAAAKIRKESGDSSQGRFGNVVPAESPPMSHRKSPPRTPASSPRGPFTTTLTSNSRQCAGRGRLRCHPSSRRLRPRLLTTSRQGSSRAALSL